MLRTIGIEMINQDKKIIMKKCEFLNSKQLKNHERLKG
jgi:hypothetical protein